MKYILIWMLSIIITIALCFLLEKLWFEFVVSTNMPMWLKYILLR